MFTKVCIYIYAYIYKLLIRKPIREYDWDTIGFDSLRPGRIRDEEFVRFLKARDGWIRKVSITFGTVVFDGVPRSEGMSAGH